MKIKRTLFFIREPLCAKSCRCQKQQRTCVHTHYIRTLSWHIFATRLKIPNPPVDISREFSPAKYQRGLGKSSLFVRFYFRLPEFAVSCETGANIPLIGSKRALGKFAKIFRKEKLIPLRSHPTYSVQDVSILVAWVSKAKRIILLFRVTSGMTFCSKSEQDSQLRDAPRGVYCVQEIEWNRLEIIYASFFDIFYFARSHVSYFIAISPCHFRDIFEMHRTIHSLLFRFAAFKVDVVLNFLHSYFSDFNVESNRSIDFEIDFTHVSETFLHSKWRKQITSY